MCMFCICNFMDWFHWFDLKRAYILEEFWHVQSVIMTEFNGPELTLRGWPDVKTQTLTSILTWSQSEYSLACFTCCRQSLPFLVPDPRLPSSFLPQTSKVLCVHVSWTTNEFDVACDRMMFILLRYVCSLWWTRPSLLELLCWCQGFTQTPSTGLRHLSFNHCCI